MNSIDNPGASQPELTPLFQYLRTLVNTAEASQGPYAGFALVEAYWNIGRIIVEIELQGQQRADYGIHLIELLSEQMTSAFGKGYSLPNMWRFKQFYLVFQILSTKGIELTSLRQVLRHELKWSHYRFLMKIQDHKQRQFYINQAADNGWSVRLLQRMVGLDYYNKVALGKTNLLPLKVLPAPSPTRSIIGGNVRTRLANLKKILLERHVGYAFVAQRQFVSVAGVDQWVELVFYHFIVNRFILIQLGEHTKEAINSFSALVEAYEKKQPPSSTKAPIGFLINHEGKNKFITTIQEPPLSSEEEACFPLSFS